MKNYFKRRRFPNDVIILAVRWYLRYALSYRDLKEILIERGIKVDHSNIFRWVQHYSPILESECRKHIKKTGKSYRVDETYIKVAGIWKYLYRAVDKKQNTIDFYFSAKIYKEFKDEQVKKKWRYFLIGLACFYVFGFGTLLSNTLNIQTIRTIWSLIGLVLVILSPYLMYYGVGKQIRE